MKEYRYSPINGVAIKPGLEGRDPTWWDAAFPMVPFVSNPLTGRKREPRFIKTNPRYAEERLLPAVDAAVAPLSPASQHEYETARAVYGHPALVAPYGQAAPAAVANAQVPRVLADDGKREDYPMFDGLLAYFPAALAEVARWSVVGNAKHNPGQPLHWAREKSTDHENKIVRHLLDARQVDKDGFVEAVALAWRALALCQTILEERGWSEGANARRGVQS